MRRIFWFVLLVLLTTVMHAQKINSKYQLSVFRATEPLQIDGLLDEATWQNAAVADQFNMVLPMDTSKARILTQVRMAYDDKNLYLSAVCNHPIGQRYIVQSLRRDFTFGKNDNFLFFMDPFNDLTNGFSFGANAAGAQWDGTMYGGGSVDLSWDNKWTSAVHAFDDKYIIEMAIPFKSIRYKTGIREWESILVVWMCKVPKRVPGLRYHASSLRLRWPTPDPSFLMSHLRRRELTYQ